MPLLALLALLITAAALAVATVAAARAARQVAPTLRAVERLRSDLQPALVRVRLDQDRARRLADRP